MLKSLKWAGQSVERISDRVGVYGVGKNRRCDEEWKPEDLYDNAEY